MFTYITIKNIKQKILGNMIFISIFEAFHLQGVRKWNVFFKNATVAKLLNILTRTDAF